MRVRLGGGLACGSTWRAWTAVILDMVAKEGRALCRNRALQDPISTPQVYWNLRGFLRDKKCNEGGRAFTAMVRVRVRLWLGLGLGLGLGLVRVRVRVLFFLEFLCVSFRGRSRYQIRPN